MTVEEIFKKIITHMVEGLMIHDELTNGYDFIGLYGFAKCHEYHYMKESQSYKCLRHYYSIHYHQLLNIENVPNPKIIPDGWYKHNTMEVDANTKRQAVKTMMEKWIEWERDTKKLYQEMYHELCGLNEIAAANEIKYYICGVDDELVHAEKKFIKLESLGYDIGSIINWQQPMYEKFKKELTHLYD